MLYRDIYNRLKSQLQFDDPVIRTDPDIDVMNFTFRSPHFTLLPGEDNYTCTEHRFASHYSYPFSAGGGFIHEVLDIHDSHVRENQEFPYQLFIPKGQRQVTKLVLLLHGFNEKSWAKYYPWAKRLVEETGQAVLLFPIAFHMNRAPHDWSEQRDMFNASRQRKELYPNILQSSLSNVAISTRLHEKPQRFVWSGLQTYYDIIHLLEQIKAGLHPVIAAEAGVHIFAYSIGAFLAEILMMADYRQYFSQSKLLLFCGGPVFNRLSPVSKFILDSEANVNLYSFLVEHLESHLAKDERLRHYLSEAHPEGMYFRSMLSYSRMADFREKRLMEMADRLYAIALEGDTVIYPYEVINTLQGKYHDIPVKVDTLSLPYAFRHESPFPETPAIGSEVSGAFDHIFKHITDWLH
jgi:hypothetical protein